MLLNAIASIFRVEVDRVEFYWNVLMGVVAGGAGVVVSALLMEPSMPKRTLYKLAVSGTIALLGIAISNKPLMTLCSAMLFVALRWFIAALAIKSFTAFVVAVALVAIVCTLAKLYPKETAAA